MPSYPPERIDLDGVALRRERVHHAELLVATLETDLGHLRPWMPWATPENVTVTAQRTRLQQVERSWDEAKDHTFLLWDADASTVLGGFGLHRRIGPGAIEIGYWLSERAVGNGYATAAAGALTSAAMALDDISRVEIHCDEANVRSAKIPQRLGYRLDRVEADAIDAPAETGRGMVWVYPPNVSQR